MNHRLLAVGDGRVCFASRHRRQGNRVQTLTRAAAACIRRFRWHVWPHGCLRLRHDGVLANRSKAHALRRGRALLGPPAAPPPRSPKSVRQWLQESMGIDLTPCPQCGASPLVRLPLSPLSTPAASQGAPRETPRFDAS